MVFQNYMDDVQRWLQKWKAYDMGRHKQFSVCIRILCHKQIFIRLLSHFCQRGRLIKNWVTNFTLVTVTSIVRWHHYTDTFNCLDNQFINADWNGHISLEINGVGHGWPRTSEASIKLGLSSVIYELLCFPWFYILQGAASKIGHRELSWEIGFYFIISLQITSKLVIEWCICGGKRGPSTSIFFKSLHCVHSI